MAILKVARLGHPILRHRSRPLAPREIASPPIQRLVDNMIETMREYGGTGLAAPQVHVPLRLIVFEVAGKGRGRFPLTILFNPRIAADSRDTAEDWEGCLSVPDLRGIVPRRRSVSVRGRDRTGRTVSFRAKDYAARVIQHETDHLDGRLYLDRMRGFETLTFLDEYERFWTPETRA